MRGLLSVRRHGLGAVLFVLGVGLFGVALAVAPSSAKPSSGSSFGITRPPPPGDAFSALLQVPFEHERADDAPAELRRTGMGIGGPLIAAAVPLMAIGARLVHRTQEPAPW